MPRKRDKIENAALKDICNELELKAAERGAQLQKINKRLSLEIAEREKVEWRIRSQNALLKLLAKISSRRGYLDMVVKYLKAWSGCRCVGIRVLDEEGQIPYESYAGFSREFWESENRLSLKRDKCVCIRAMTGVFEEKESHYITSGGSFVCGNTLQFVSVLSKEEQAKFRGVCIKNGFLSVGVVPIRYKNNTIAAIHLADEKEGAIGSETVEFIESLAMIIGEGIHNFDMDDRMRQSYLAQNLINSLLRFSLEKITIEEILDKALDMIFSIPAFAFESTGTISLVGDKPGVLELKAQRGLPKYLQKECKYIPFGKCLCGKAALTRQVQFTGHINGSHAIVYPGMRPHGHYCVPIVFVEAVFGVINIYLQDGFCRDRKKEEFLIAVANALAGIIHRRNVEDKLMQANERLERIFSNTSLMIAYMDREFNFIRVNEAYAQADSRTPGFFIGKNHFDLYPDNENKEIFRKVAETGQPYFAYERPFKYENNPERVVTYWDWSLHAVKNTKGEVEGVILCLINVTERKRAQEELFRAQEELANVKRLSDIGALAAIVAHELRNPLGVIRTAAYNIKRKAQNPLLESHLANIDKKIDEADQIINNLLFYSRIKDPQYQTVRIYEALNECINFHKRKFSNLRVSVRKRINSVKNDFIDADPVQMREVFNNILSNAYEAFLHKGGRIEIEARKNGAGDMRITVSDNAGGIGEDDLKHIFEPFFTTKARGIGLGLSVCHQIISRHGGTITAQSEKGKGTVFTVVLTSKKKEPPAQNPQI